MIKKIIKLTNFSQQEKAVARYMKEVNDIQAAGLTRRDLFKMGLTAGVGGLTAIGGGRGFLPNLAEASGGSSSSGSTGIISPPVAWPWTDPLPIPKTCVPVSACKGPTPEKSTCLETDPRWNPGKNATDNFTEARTEDHQRWDELGGLAACTQYDRSYALTEDSNCGFKCCMVGIKPAMNEAITSLNKSLCSR
ncbi:MAG: hypothetical protein NTW85_00105 [Methylococcales bacterium]|nr:hypothetical protein [Methylococcales bacterium]